MFIRRVGKKVYRRWSDGGLAGREVGDVDEEAGGEEEHHDEEGRDQGLPWGLGPSWLMNGTSS